MANEIQPGSRVVRVPARRDPANSGPAASTMTPKEIVGIIRRHIFMIVVFTILGTCAGVGSWFLVKTYFPKYTSIGAIEVLPPIDVDPTKIGGPQPNPDLFYQFRSTKAFRFRDQGFLQDLLLDDDIREMKWFKKYTTTADKVEYLADNLRGSAARDRSHIVVSMKTSSPKEAKETVDEAIGLFLAKERKAAGDDSGAKLEATRAQHKKIQGEFDALERDLKGMRDTTNTSLGQKTYRDYLDDTLANLEQVENELTTEIGETNENIIILTRRKNRGDYDEIVKERVEQDQLARNMRLRVDTLEVELKRLKSSFGDDHNRVKETAKALDEQKTALMKWQAKIGALFVDAQLAFEMEQLSRLQAKLVTQKAQVQSARNTYRDVSRLRADYETIVVRRDAKRAELEEMNSFIEKLSIVKANIITLSKVKIGLSPREPLEMSSPKLLIFLPGGFLLGFMIGIGLAFAVELLNDLLRSPSEVIKHMRAPLLGTICHRSEDRTVKRLNLYHVVREAPYSIMSEAYRQFRTSLTLSGSGTSHKTLLVTSGNPGDGKTTVAVNTAYTFVADGKRVLLIDTNFRKPATTVLFERRKSDGTELEHPDFGLSNYLMDQCSKDSVIRSSELDGFDIIDSGPLPLNPSELLASDKMIELIKTVRQQYDYVIIDGPPLLVSEAKILASEVDGTILVFNAEQTKRGAAQRALRELKEVNANVLGTILVGVKSMKGGYFHEKYDTYNRYQKVKPKLTS
ncbi:MAG: polysaccharide biosynthesis tyrosine autokinase [Planctomycetes bacterium]|nr:polysaccharide biosynthesis tyrosine autokinase [Planctomycetota bacterium]